MNYELLLDLATDLGYKLAMCGAETYRIEESITRVLASYDICAEAFAIPNCLTVSMRTPEGDSLTRMRRIGYHGNDLDSVERYSNLSRRICAEHPDTDTLQQWLLDTDTHRISYRLPIILLGSFLGAGGFSILFGATLTDAIFAGLCGLIVGLVNHFLDRLETNTFFRTIIATFIMAVPAYAMGAIGLVQNTDAVVIGALMLLVPGLLFTNAMRDIIFGDTNSGINRIVQVFLIAAAIALGTGAAWNIAEILGNTPAVGSAPGYSGILQAVFCFIGCIGFAITFNLHGFGAIICCIGGMLTWSIYALSIFLGAGDIFAYFLATVFAALYSEIMARVRKFPAISYLVVSIFPLIPGAGVYYTMSYVVRGEMDLVTEQGLHTVAIAGAMAVAILLVSTIVRLLTTKRNRQNHLHPGKSI